jgi:hypothetical protein
MQKQNTFFLTQKLKISCASRVCFFYELEVYAHDRSDRRKKKKLVDNMTLLEPQQKYFLKWWCEFLVSRFFTKNCRKVRVSQPRYKFKNNLLP